MGLAPVLVHGLVCWFVGLFFCHACFLFLLLALWFRGRFWVFSYGLVLRLFSLWHGEQRVLVAAPRFALYVARNKHPLLAFWC